jgi:hypothetical protein
MRFQFDARRVAPNVGITVEQWPIGWYPVMIKSHAIKPTEKSTPQEPANRLSLMIECLDGPMKGKPNYIGLNIQNPSAKAVEIALGNLSAICWVVGMPSIDDLDQLNGRPFFTYAKVTERGNEFNDFKDVNGRTPVELAQAGGGMVTSQAGAANIPPASSWAPGAPAAPPAAPAAPAWGPPGGAPAAPPAAAPAWGLPAPAAPAPAAPAPAAAPAWGPPAATAPAAPAAPAWGAPAATAAAPPWGPPR